MNNNALKFCAACAALSAVTTIGIHSFIKGPSSFEESLLVYKSTYYVFSKWWVIVHCLLVVISMYGLSHYLEKKEQPFASLGFSFYAAFGVTEILRMFLVLSYLGGLRDQYVAAGNAELQGIIKLSIDSFNGLGTGLFSAFMLFIILGNCFLGWGCITLQKTKLLGAGLLLWAAVQIFSLATESFQSTFSTTFIEYFNVIFQPAIRVWIAITILNILRSKERTLIVASA